MGAWSVVMQCIPSAELIPVCALLPAFRKCLCFPQSYYFARDDRVYKAFLERCDTHKAQIARSCPRRLRWQMRVLTTCLQGRQLSFRVSCLPILFLSTLTFGILQRKIELIEAQLDHEPQDPSF